MPGYKNTKEWRRFFKELSKLLGEDEAQYQNRGLLLKQNQYSNRALYAKGMKIPKMI